MVQELDRDCRSSIGYGAVGHLLHPGQWLAYGSVWMVSSSLPFPLPRVAHHPLGSNFSVIQGPPSLLSCLPSTQGRGPVTTVVLGAALALEWEPRNGLESTAQGPWAPGIPSSHQDLAEVLPPF